MPTLATKKPMNAPIDDADSSATSSASEPVPAADVVEQDEDRHADAAGDAGGQVDLGEEDHEHQRDREHHQRRRLGHQVREVRLREEERGQEREQDAEHDQAGEGGQHAHLAAAHPLAGSRGTGRDRALVAGRDRRGGGCAAVWAAVSVDGFVDFSSGVVTSTASSSSLLAPRCRSWCR